MKKHIGYLFGLLLVLVIQFSAQGGEVPITTVDDLVANSTFDGTNLKLSPNANGYIVKDDITISWNDGGWKSAGILFDDANGHLTINSLSNSDNASLTEPVGDHDFTLGDGNIYATGGLQDSFGISNYALQFDNFRTVAGKSGNVYAYSRGERIYAIYVGEDFIHNGSGTIHSEGGINVFGDFITGVDSGEIYAEGTSWAGLQISGKFVHNGGDITAVGALTTVPDLAGGTSALTGIFANGFENLGSGNIYASGKLAAGIAVGLGDFIHRGTGEIVAEGSELQIIDGTYYSGTGILALYGFEAHSGSGKVTAKGGGNEYGGWGIYANTMYMDTTLVISRTDSKESVYLGNTDFVGGTADINRVGLTFGANSTLVPVVDLAKSNDLASGLIHLSEGTILIESGATLAPTFINTASMQAGTERMIRFMEAGDQDDPSAKDAKIEGEFTTLVKPTLTFDYEVEAVKTADDDGYYKTYYLKFGRTNTPGGVVTENGYCSDNTRRMLNAMTTGLEGVTTPEAATLNALYDVFAGFTDPLDLAKYATRLSLTLNPHGFTRLTAFSLRQADATQQNLNSRLSALRNEYRHAGSREHVYSGAPKRWNVWADGLYMKSWRHESITCGFVDTDESFGGLALGVGGMIGDLSLGFQAHYLRGEVEGHGYDNDSDTYGFLASARYDFPNPGRELVPWIQLVAGYSYLDHDQKRRDTLMAWHKSSPDADLVRLGAAFGLDLAIGNRAVITPVAGFDYTHLDQGGYRESDQFNLGLSVRARDVNSFRPFIGVEFDVNMTEKLHLLGRAKYRYEAGDRNVRLDTSFVGVPTVKYRFAGERVSRSSGNLGVGLKYDISDRASVGANYDVWLEEKFIGHQFHVGFGLAF